MLLLINLPQYVIHYIRINADADARDLLQWFGMYLNHAADLNVNSDTKMDSPESYHKRSLNKEPEFSLYTTGCSKMIKMKQNTNKCKFIMSLKYNQRTGR